METGLLQLTLIDCYTRLRLVWHGLVYTRIGYKGVSPEKPSMPKKASRKLSNHAERQTTTKALCLKCKAIYNVLHLFSKRRVNCVHGKPKKILSQITQACHFASRWCFDWPDSHRKCKSTRLLVRGLALPHPPMLYIPCFERLVVLIWNHSTNSYIRAQKSCPQDLLSNSISIPVDQTAPMWLHQNVEVVILLIFRL